MDMSLTSIHVEYTWVAKLFFLFALIYPMVFLSRRLHEWRSGMHVRASVAPELFLPFFAALAATSSSCALALRGIREYGGGPAPGAAGAAESQGPLFLAAIEVFALALAALIVSARSKSIPESPKRSLTHLCAVFGLLVAIGIIGELAICTHLVSGEPLDAALRSARVLTAANIVLTVICAGLVVAMPRETTASWRASASLAAGSLVLTAILWRVIEHYRLIAVGGTP